MQFLNHGLRIICAIALFACTMTAHAQDAYVDSLEKAVVKMPGDTNKVKALNEISWELLFQSKYDEARSYANKALALSDTLHYLLGSVKAITRLGLADYDQGDQQGALRHYFHALELSEEKNFTVGMNMAYNNIGNSYYLLRNYELALDYHFKALKTAEQIKDSTNISKSYNNIGNVYYSMKNYDKALEYYLTSTRIQGKLITGEVKASLLSNIGQVYMHKHDLDKALDYSKQALAIREETGYPIGITNSLNTIGLILFYGKKYADAIPYYERALKINEEVGNKEGVEVAHYNLANSYIELGKYKEAISHALISKELCVEMESRENVAQSYSQLAGIYHKMGDDKQAVKYFKSYISIRDSLEAEAKLQEMGQKEEQYKFEREMERKQMEQEKQQALANETLKRQRLTIWWIGSGGLLLLVLGAVALRAYSQKRKDNKLLTHQKTQIEEKHREIQDSINYAKRIQTAILPSSQNLDTIFSESFVLLKPKAVVSGDFYWYYATPDKIIWTVSDCTGHGVPGAFMSMIGNAFLNEIIIENGVTDPGKILDRLREKVIRALEQQGQSTQKDGMDIALCVFNRHTRELQYAGAYNPVWIVKASDNGLIELKADKMPIGAYEADSEPFKVQNITVDKGDCIYLFSDGYADQFGGEKGKKFKYSQLKELVVSLRDMRMHQQHNTLDETFETWRGDLEQIDDVCVFGVRV